MSLLDTNVLSRNYAKVRIQVVEEEMKNVKIQIKSNLFFAEQILTSYDNGNYSKKWVEMREFERFDGDAYVSSKWVKAFGNLSTVDRAKYIDDLLGGCDRLKGELNKLQEEWHDLQKML